MYLTFVFVPHLKIDDGIECLNDTQVWRHLYLLAWYHNQCAVARSGCIRERKRNPCISFFLCWVKVLAVKVYPLLSFLNLFPYSVPRCSLSTFNLLNWILSIHIKEKIKSLVDKHSPISENFLWSLFNLSTSTMPSITRADSWKISPPAGAFFCSSFASVAAVSGQDGCLFLRSWGNCSEFESSVL